MMRRVLRAGRVWLGLGTVAWILGSATPAWAHGSHGSSGGSSGGSHGSSGGSSGGSHGSHGSSGGSSGGSHGSHGSSGGSSGGHHSNGGSGGSTNGAPNGAPNTAPQTPPTPAPAPAMSARDASAPVRLTVLVPADAKLFIEDQPTQLTGTRRDFISPRMKIGQDFVYSLRVELTRDGQKVTKIHQLPVRAGNHAVVEFGPSALNPNELVASVRR